jgi:hypothetical protein
MTIPFLMASPFAQTCIVPLTGDSFPSMTAMKSLYPDPLSKTRIVMGSGNLKGNQFYCPEKAVFCPERRIWDGIGRGCLGGERGFEKRMGVVRFIFWGVVFLRRNRKNLLGPKNLQAHSAQDAVNHMVTKY